MPISTIPILSEDYPLFDWDDHLQSYYALGEGELVSGFQKETWNAIIDKALAALSAAGMSWDPKYTTAAAAKVTKAYGPLSAKRFNSVRHNIDRPAPVGWGWANNPNLRGYVGREDFKGYAEHGLDGDLFYAEYLLEMVRRLNLLLAIMKGTANLKEMDSPTQSMTESIHSLLAQPSAPMAFSDPAFSSFICGLQANKAGQFAYSGKAKSLDQVTAQKLQSRPLNTKSRAASKQKSQMQMPKVKKLEQYGESMPSLHQALMDVFNALYLSSGHGISNTSVKTDFTTLAPKLVSVEELSNTDTAATQTILSPHSIQGAQSGKCTTEAAAVAPQAIRPAGADLANSSMDITFEKIRPRRMRGNVLSGVKCIAILDSAWLSPIWVNGKLYIRQAYETNRTDAALEVR